MLGVQASWTSGRWDRPLFHTLPTATVSALLSEPLQATHPSPPPPFVGAHPAPGALPAAGGLAKFTNRTPHSPVEVGCSASQSLQNEAQLLENGAWAPHPLSLMRLGSSRSFGSAATHSRPAVPWRCLQRPLLGPGVLHLSPLFLHFKPMQDLQGCSHSVHFSFSPSFIRSVSHQTCIWSPHTRKEKGGKTPASRGASSGLMRSGQAQKGGRRQGP